MEKIRTGVAGLDEMLGGGLIRNRVYLLCGGPGVGKTIFGMQFLAQGLKEGKKGMFISLEDSVEELKENMASFIWGQHKLKGIDILDATPEIKTGTWKIKGYAMYADVDLNVTNLINTIEKRTSFNKPERLVVDSVTSLELMFSNEAEKRKAMLGFMRFLSAIGCTSLLISESDPNEPTSLGHLVSGVIYFASLIRDGGVRKVVQIQKMCGSDFDEKLRLYGFTNKGMVVLPKEKIV
ncbi:MAG: RAD55 family ATPase [Candidatus Methanofastidiosia archaeon]